VTAPWIICGTVPDDAFAALSGGLASGLCSIAGDRLQLDGLGLNGQTAPVRRGTPALIAACCAACFALGIDPPQALLAADTGRGEGSKKLYARLCAELPNLAPRGLTFHYLFPDVAGHDQVLFAVQALAARPMLVADAGFMYAAKMSGQAREYDLFTPDAGELAFLADELAPHPFYTRGFLLGSDADAAQLARRAWDSGGAAQTMLIKGGRDLVAESGVITRSIDGPDTPAMEAIGGTGDTLTGMATALAMAGRPLPEACAIAAHANRLLGALARPTPATPVAVLVPHVAEALRVAMER
jgi:hypothetical protein